MSRAKTRTSLVRLAAALVFASAGVLSLALAAESPASSSRKDAPAHAVKVREVGKLTSLRGAVVKLTFALDGKRLVVESTPPPPAMPKILGSGFFLQRPVPTVPFTVWNISSRQVAHLKPMAYQPGGSLLSTDVRSLAVWHTVWQSRASGPQLELEFHDVGTQRKIARPKVWKWLEKSMEPLAFAPDGKAAAVKDSKGGCVALFDVKSGKKISVIRMDDDRWLSVLPGVVFSGDGKCLAVPLADSNSLAVCEVATGKVLQKFAKFAPGSVLALTPDGKTLALGNRKAEEVTIWDVGSGKQTDSWQGHKPGVFDLAYSGDGKVLFAAGNKVILVWDASAKREIGQLRGHTSAVTVLAVSPDGKRLASGGLDKSVCLWDISAYAVKSKDEPRRQTEPRR